MAAKKKKGAKQAKRPPAQQAKVARKLIAEMKRLLKPLPLEVLGHMESEALCCGNGTVALVKIDFDEVVNPTSQRGRK